MGLIGMGIALIGLATALWLSNGSPAESTTQKRDTTRVSGSAAAAAGGSDSGASRACGCKSSGKTVVESVEAVSGGGPSKRSETLVITLFGLGTLLFLCGVFYGRIQEVTLPGGAGFKLGESAQAKVKSTVVEAAKSNPDLTDDPETIARLYEMTLQFLMTRYPQPGGVVETEQGYYVAGMPIVTDFPEEKVKQAAVEAAEALAASDAI